MITLHCKDTYRKFETNIPRNETARPRSQFLHSCINLFCCSKIQADRSWEYIDRSQIHKCGNWERGRAVSLLGIHQSDLVCSVGLTTVERPDPKDLSTCTEFPPHRLFLLKGIRSATEWYHWIDLGIVIHRFVSR
jgi:hypothetical protein